ncbi:lysophospholipid acyltransferase family protein [Bordetella sp. 02P26C-1]|uniref:lysophospholipid acyltransferase family protein n=1 Tax=Bordetella sp. 02P26C-1 TaxID=2683195 RepID=UPI0013525A12|nr:lysophospholipid acyltransferase family protein [Bordetella sp. 02P26C-1]MVW79381.1 lysophospholipid acyltransferase family protein [Bordetella sp. 02P26C-1]
MLLALFRFIALLPLPVLHVLGRFLGRVVYAFPGRYRQRLRANAAQAGYPDPSFARRAAAETGAMMMEMPKVWFRPEESLAKTVSDDFHVVEQALAENRGILFLTPHLGCFEITARYVAIARHIPVTVMFRPPRMAAFAPLLDTARNTPGLQAVPANRQGVREFVRTLRRGGTVGLLPDQAPGEGDGVWAPFFGRMAYTMTLAGKLAAQTGVAVIVLAGERLPRGRGWRIHFSRVPEPLPDDPQAQATLFNAAMEKLIRQMPEQYLWSYNRYKTPRGAPPAPPMPDNTTAGQTPTGTDTP